MNNFVILNLAIALACGLFVFCVGIETAKVIEVSKYCSYFPTTSSLVDIQCVPPLLQGLCVFVTALLHYFFLATFCWTLCEAVLLYNMLVKVFDAHKQGWLYFYAALGWGECTCVSMAHANDIIAGNHCQKKSLQFVELVEFCEHFMHYNLICTMYIHTVHTVNSH